MTATLYDLGPCQVVFGGDDLGATFGDVVFRSEITSQVIQEDQKGTTPVNEIMTGRNVTVEVPLTRSQVSVLQKVLQLSELSGTTLKVKNPVGVSLAANAKTLILKPIVNNAPTSDSSEWLTIHKAAPKESFEIVFNNSGQRVYRITFVGFPSEDSGTSGEIYRIG